MAGKLSYLDAGTVSAIAAPVIACGLQTLRKAFPLTTHIVALLRRYGKDANLLQ